MRSNKREALRAAPLSNCLQSQEELKHQLEMLPKAPVPWHFIVAKKEQRFLRNRISYSICQRQLPRNAFVQINSDICLASPELVFVQLARKVTLPYLVKLGDELCGTYMPLIDSDGTDINRAEPLASIASLSAFVDDVSWMAGARHAREAIRLLVDNSASPKESELEMILSFPPRLRGYGIPKPTMNERVDFDRHAALIANRSFARCDLCWRDSKLDVEYDGGPWHQGKRASQDKARSNALQHMGFRTIFISKNEFEFYPRFDAIAHDIAKHLGFRLRDRNSKAESKRRQLHFELLRSGNDPLFRSIRFTGNERTIWSM